MSEIDAELNRRAQAYLKNKGSSTEEGANPLKEINVSVKTEGIEKMMKYNTSLEEQLEQERTLREDYEAKLKLIAEKEIQRVKQTIGCSDPTINDPESLKAWAKGKGIDPNRVKAFDDVKEEQGGKGNVGLTSAQIAHERGSGNSEGYPDTESMVKDVVQRAKTEPKMKEAKDQLWQQYIKMAKEQPQQVLNRIVFTDNPEKTCVEKVKESQNREWRRKHGYKEGEN